MPLNWATFLKFLFFLSSSCSQAGRHEGTWEFYRHVGPGTSRCVFKRITPPPHSFSIPFALKLTSQQVVCVMVAETQIECRVCYTLKNRVPSSLWAPLLCKYHVWGLRWTIYTTFSDNSILGYMSTMILLSVLKQWCFRDLCAHTHKPQRTKHASAAISGLDAERINVTNKS